jgi:tetratricopeptide (TPR) repeat protein
MDTPSFPAWVVAALLGVPKAQGEDLLDGLVDARLVETLGRDIADQPRYRLHDLVRLFARERATIEDQSPARAHALASALGGWLHLAEQGRRMLPAELTGSGVSAYQHGTAAGGVPDMPPTDPLTWFDAEREALVAGVEQACAEGLDELACSIATVLTSFFVARGPYHDCQRVLEAALTAARRLGGVQRRAQLQQQLGALHVMQDRYDDALPHLYQARAGFHESNDSRGEAAALTEIGAVHRLKGRYEDALACLEAAARCAANVGDRHAEAYAWLNIGAVHMDRGRQDQALSAFRRTLRVSTACGANRLEARALRSIGLARQAQGQFESAADCFHRALLIAHRLGDRLDEAFTQQALGEVRRRQGRYTDAREFLDRCLTAFRELDERFGEALALLNVGEVLCDEGRAAQAKDWLDASLRIWDELQLPLWRARTLSVMTGVHEAEGSREAALRTRHLVQLLLGQLGLTEGSL